MNPVEATRKTLNSIPIAPIARLAAMPYTTIASFASGKTREPGATTLSRIQAAISKFAAQGKTPKAKPSEKTAKAKAKARPISDSEYQRLRGEASNPTPGTVGAIWRSSTTVSERQQALRSFDLATVRAAIAVGGVQDSVTKALEARERVLSRKAAAR